MHFCMAVAYSTGIPICPLLTCCSHGLTYITELCFESLQEVAADVSTEGNPEDGTLKPRRWFHICCQCHSWQAAIQNILLPHNDGTYEKNYFRMTACPRTDLEILKYCLATSKLRAKYPRILEWCRL